MGVTRFRHSQRLMELESSRHGNLVTLVKPSHDFWTQRHRLRGVGTLSPSSAIQIPRETTRRPSPPFCVYGVHFTLQNAPERRLLAVSYRQKILLHHDIALIALNKTAIQHFV